MIIWNFLFCMLIRFLLYRLEGGLRPFADYWCCSFRFLDSTEKTLTFFHKSMEFKKKLAMTLNLDFLYV